jgi:protein ImuA
MPRAVDLTALRDRIRRLEQPARHGVLPFGAAAIDTALPGGGLALGALHEIVGAGGDEEDGAASAGFAAGILARLGVGYLPTSPQPSPPPGGPLRAEREHNAAAIPLRPSGGRGGDPSRQRWGGEVGPCTGPVLWCLKRSDLYGPGLAAHGLDPGRLVVVSVRRDEDILWVVEEGLRTGAAAGLTAVVGEIGRLPMAAGRRLQLAAEHSGVTALLLRRWRNAAEAAAERGRPTATVTRWRVGALPSLSLCASPPAEGRGFFREGVGRPCWRVELMRVRGGVPANWEVEAADATGHVRVSAELADRPTAPSRQKAGQIAAEPLRRAG